tara:strand:+ start:2256 stop:2504 length:249 start_codon:yes stop_codon:yes gene_type:complete
MYYTLLIKHELNDKQQSKWVVEFGDEDKESVQWELEYNWLNNGTKKKNTKIIYTEMNQKIIDECVENLNILNTKIKSGHINI